MRFASLLLVVALAAGCSAGETSWDPPRQTSAPPAPAIATTTTTPVAVEPEPWAVIVIGDFGVGAEAEYAVAAAARDWAMQHPETVALVTTGDNFYIADVTAAWEVPYGWVADAGLEVWAIPGNHDIESPGQWQASVDAFGSFPRWRTRVAGGVTFVLLDSNQAADPAQHAWIEQVIDGLGGEPWVAVFHHPVVSCGGHASEAPVSRSWEPLLVGAALTLSGHEHNYERLVAPSGWTVITGGGGQSLHRIGACPPGSPDLVVGLAVHHFVTIEGRGDRAVVTARRPDGAVLDRFLVDLSLRP